MDSRQIAVDIFLSGVESVKPDNLINRYVSVSNDTLRIENLLFKLSEIKNIYVVGAGKASAMMAQATETILKSKITAGHIVTKYHHSVPLTYIKTTEAGHPVPDENGIKGTEQILSIVQNAGKEDLVICLISGGGSALLADVPDGCTLADLKSLNSILLKSGATINEMNCIRKHLSNVKGGQLAKAASPARVVSLILSDVIGDPLDVIASGPTAPDPGTFAEALAIVDKYKLRTEMPDQIIKILMEGYEHLRPETLKESDEILKQTSNLIIGTNKLALSTAKEKAESFGYETSVITNTLEGDVEDVAQYLVQLAKNTQLGNYGEKICLLFSGEPTVKVIGNGLGGRNQHLALICANLLQDVPGITLLSGGTDGSDGPTDAAGAVADSSTSLNAIARNLDIESFIRTNDAYHFFKAEGGLLVTGPTQTNVMDLMVILIQTLQTQNVP